MLENLKAIITRFKNGTQTLEDIKNLLLLIKEGKLTLATGEGSVAVAGNLSDTVIINGNYNVTIIGTDAEAIKAALLKSHVKQFLNVILLPIAYHFKQSHLLSDNQVLQDNKKPRYIPIQVTLERFSQHLVETPLGYAEQTTELKRLYAYKGFDEEQARRKRVDWKEAKKKYQKLMVIADPGMGKSTLLRMDAWETAQEQRQNLYENKISLEDVNFPVFLRLSDLAKEKDNEIIDSILNLMRKDAAAEIWDLLKEKLETGKCLILLDALDEVPKDYRDSLRTKLNNFASTYTGKIICTSRIIGYDKTFFTSDKEVEIIPFGQNQIEEYIKWFINDKSVVEGLIKELRNKPRIQGLAQNPLLLSLICRMYQQDKSLTLPARRTEIYRQTIDNFMSKEWKEEKEYVKRKDAKLKLLSEIAYNLSISRKDNILFDDLEKTIIKIFNERKIIKENLNSPEPAALIKELSEDGILRKMGLGEKEEESYYLFLHRTFQEYLTAMYLAKDEKEALKHIWEHEWHETLTLLAGLLKEEEKDPSELINAIKEESDDIFYTLKLLAGRCIAECQLDDNDLVDEIYKFWHTFPSVNFIHSTVVTIGQVNSQMFEKLKKTLEDTNESEQVRREAALALGEIRKPEAVQALIASLKSAYPSLKRQAALALGDIGTSEAVQELINYGFKHPDNGFKENEVRSALATIGNSEVVKELIKALNNKEENISFRSAAAFALAKIGNDRAVQALITALNKQSNNNSVQKTVVSALGEISNSKAVSALIKVLNDNKEDIEIRTEAISALGKIGKSEAVSALIKVLNDNKENIDIRTGAISALGKIGNFEAVQAVINACDDQNRFVNSAALKALGKINNSDALQVLGSALKHENDDVKRKAKNACNKITENISLPETNNVAPEFSSLQEIIKYVRWINNNSEKRNAAELALRNIDNPLDVPYLITVLNDPNEYGDVKNKVASVLGKIGNNQAMEALILALKDKERDVIRSAASALEEFGTDETLTKLIELSKTEINIYDPDVFCLARRLAIKFNRLQQFSL
jgi:HEAT repeat protein